MEDPCTSGGVRLRLRALMMLKSLPAVSPINGPLGVLITSAYNKMRLPPATSLDMVLPQCKFTTADFVEDDDQGASLYRVAGPGNKNSVIAPFRNSPLQTRRTACERPARQK
ncbi:MAG: hypothetical protein Q9174_006697, partial [Haloplaca sp. 1 TL-2023]